MNQFVGLCLRNAGLVAAVGSAGILHRRWKRGDQQRVLADSIIVCQPEEEDWCCVPGPGSMDLELKQVLVAFCPGACTPMYNLDGFKKAVYEEEMVARRHVHTNFPYRKLSRQDPSSEDPPDWSDYEKQLQCRILPGGSIYGQLTSYGQEQMYSLGIRLKDDYKDELELHSFDPSTVSVMSPNIQRHVNSATCALAGIFGKERLAESAFEGKPAEIVVEDGNKCNILIPETQICCLLQKVNLAAKNLHGNIPDMRVDRDLLESHIDLIQAERLAAVTEAQEKYDKIIPESEMYETEPIDTKELAFNEDRQPYLKDERIDTILSERHAAIDKVELFWHNVFSNNPYLSKQISKRDFKALAYLRRIEIEDFSLKFQKGTRYKFYFDTNPYFHNSVLVKEVYVTDDPWVCSSTSTRILWKPCFHLYPPKPEAEDCEDTPESSDNCNICNANESSCTPLATRTKKKKKEKKRDKKTCACAEGEKGPSFFTWFVEENDQFEPMGVIIKYDAWRQPLAYYKARPFPKDEGGKEGGEEEEEDEKADGKPNLDFVAMRDDMVAREAHGYRYPKELKRFRGLAEENGARILFYANAGQHHLERCMVTQAVSGRLLKEMEEKMKLVSKGSSVQTLHLYSCSHGMLTSLLEALGMWDFRWPKPASELRLELYQGVEERDQFFVRVLYQGEERKCRGQCETLVTLEDFCDVIKPYVSSQREVDQLCRSFILEKEAQCMLPPKGQKCRPEVLSRIAAVPAGM